MILIGNSAAPFSSLVGPVSSTDRAIATWNGSAGITLRSNSTVLIDSNGNLNSSGSDFLFIDTTHCLGVKKAQTSGTDYRVDKIYAKRFLSVGNIGGTNPPYGNNNDLVTGMIEAGNQVNATAVMGSNSLLNSEALGFFTFIKSGSSNFPGFYTTDNASDFDVYFSIAAIASARSNLLKFGGDGQLTLMKSSGANLLVNTDGAGNIGAAEAHRFDKAYIKTSLNSPLLTLPDDSANDSVAASTVSVSGANKTAGTGNGGDIRLVPGTSAGGNGGFVIIPGDSGTLGIGDASNIESVAAGTFAIDVEKVAGNALINASAQDGTSQAGFTGNSGTVAFELYADGTQNKVIFQTDGIKPLVLSAGSSYIQTTEQTRVASLGVGNSASATIAVGLLAKKIEVFDSSGTSLGYIPVYASIT